MTIIQVAYLFDSDAFRKEALPLASAVERGDYTPALQRAQAIINQLQTSGQEWILDDPKSNPLPSITGWKAPLTAKEIGRCFLVILSDYLRPASASLYASWSVLLPALPRAGWSELEARLLTHGYDTAALLRADRATSIARYTVLESDQDSNDFALWVRTGYGSTGWLDTTTAQILLARLQLILGKIAQVDQDMLQRDTVLAVGPNITAQDLLAAYERAVEMLMAASEVNSGLFITIS